MTPKRKAALQWFHDRGEIGWFDATSPSNKMRKAMMADGQLQKRVGNSIPLVMYSLTDKGRRDLHEAGR